MRLSLVLELLLFFILLAFAASRVIEPRTLMERKAQRQGPPNRYCACTNLMCNCCREFSLPVVPIKGPGCASLTYLQGDSMMITMSFGDRVLHNTTITGKKPKPVCMPLPGGISKFCGRVYGISRQGENFKACLGLELRALDDLEAALRVSCFKFGPQGLNLEPALPVPTADPTNDDDDDDDKDEDDDDDDYGIVDDDDDDDDDDDFGIDDDDDDDDDASENDVSPDYAGFSVFGDDFFGGIFGESNKKKKTTPVTKPKPVVKPQRLSTEKPLVSATPRPVKPVNKPVTRPVRVTRPARPLRSTTTRKPPTRRPIRTTPTTTTTTTTPTLVTRAPETTEIPEEPVTSTAITITMVQADDEAEKADSNTMNEVYTTESLEDTTDEASTEVITDEDPKKQDPQAPSNSIDDDEDEDDDDDDDEDEDEDEDEEEEEEEEEETVVNDTQTDTPQTTSENVKKDEDEDDDDILDLGLDDDDDEDNDDKGRKHEVTVKPLIRGARTHRRMRI